MQTQSYLIPLPLTEQEIIKGIHYIDYFVDHQLLSSTNLENIQYLQNGNFKEIYLQENLPQFIKEILPDKILQILHQKTDQYPFQQLIQCPSFPEFKMQIFMQIEKNKNKVATSSLQIDPILEYPNQYKAYQDQINRIFTQNYNIENLINWQNESQNISYLNIQIKTFLYYGEANKIIEVEILENIRKYLLYYYKNLLIAYKKWNKLTLKQIQEKQMQLINRQNKKQIQSQLLFTEQVKNYQDILKKTQYSQVIKLKQKFLFEESMQDISVIQQNNNINQNGYHNSHQINQNQNNINNNKYRKMSTNPNSLNNSQNFSKLYMRQNIIKKKTGMVYKKGEGPLDWNWNPRYFVLDCEKLMYYKNINDIYPRDTLFLEGSTVSDLQEMDEREHVFCIELANTERKIYVSCDDKMETQQWQKDIKSAAGYNSDQISDNRSEAITEERNQKFSSKNINNLFKMNEFPDFINSDLTHFLESFPNDLENNNIQKWHQLEYRNGQHIYKKTDSQQPSLITHEGQENNINLQQNQNKQKNGPIISSVFVMTITQIYLYFNDILALNIQLILTLLIGLISFFIVKPKNSKNNKNHQNFEFDETSSKIIVPDNIDHIFSYLKKNSFKQKIDLYLVNYNKSESVTNLEKNTNFELQFNNQNIKAKIRKTRFINDQTYYIIYDYDYINEENNSKPKKKNLRPEEIQVKEIFILQKINENQTVIYLYQKLSSNFIDSFTLNSINLKRIQQLQVLREKIQYEVKKTIAIEQENQNLQQNQKKIKKALQPGDSENPDLIMQIQLPEELKESFQEEQNKVKLLQSNQIPQGQEGLNLEQRKPGYKKLKDGRVHCFNKKEIDSQKGLIQELLAKVGQQLIEGKSIVGISLPVKIFEPRSTIERICDNWVYLPIYLGLAGQTTDPIERLKYVITFCMSGLYNSIKQQKPFNPILGETFQGFFSDGTSIDIEHTSHHPPISHYILQDPQKTFKFTGYYEYKAKLTYTGNSIIGRQQGPQTITFKDGQKITWELPSQKVNGFIIGDRTLEWMGTSLFKIHKSGYQCEIKFFESGFLTSAKHSTDHFEGNIVHESNPEKVISKAFGCWTEFVEFDGKRYWDIKYIEPSKVIKSQGPLDSDCRYRQDSIYLARGDQKLSAEWKHKLEVLQRKDRAARIAYFNKTKV